MVKSKPKQPPNDTDECVHDGWVIVKKQKVTILIPPLPITEPWSIPNPGPTPSHPIPNEKLDHITSPQPDPPLPILKTMPPVTTKPVTTFSNPQKSNRTVKVRNPRNYEPACSVLKARKRCGNLINGHVLLNSKMRALNLEKKIQRAGGLDSWLMSLGLGQFVKIFRCERVGKVQLVNLTMKKLKDMGADAVGPRRKLMHAIDCLW